MRVRGVRIVITVSCGHSRAVSRVQQLLATHGNNVRSGTRALTRGTGRVWVTPGGSGTLPPGDPSPPRHRPRLWLSEARGGAGAPTPSRNPCGSVFVDPERGVGPLAGKQHRDRTLAV